MAKTTKIQRDDAVERVMAGEWTQAEAARQLNISAQAVAKILRCAGVPPTKEAALAVTEEERQRILALYGSGVNAPEISTLVLRSKWTVTRIINEAGVALGPAQANIRRLSAEARQSMVADYLDGASLVEAAEAFDVSKQTIIAELRRRGIARRHVGRKTRFADEPETRAQILKGYENGATIPLLADVYRCSRDAIKQVLTDANVALRKDGPGKCVFQFIDRKGREFWMRSSWEIKTAIFLDQKERDWDYEKESYEIGLRRRYTPDFWVYDADGKLAQLLDVKGWLYPESDERIGRFRTAYPGLPFELWGQEELTAQGILAIALPAAPTGKKRTGLRSRFSKEEVREAIRLYESCMSVGQVAEAMNRSESAVARQLQLLGKTRGRAETKKMLSADQSTRDLIAETYLSGLSISKTAGKLGVSRDIVAQEISSRGLSRNLSCAQLLNTRAVS